MPKAKPRSKSQAKRVTIMKAAAKKVPLHITGKVVMAAKPLPPSLCPYDDRPFVKSLDDGACIYECGHRILPNAS